MDNDGTGGGVERVQHPVCTALDTRGQGEGSQVWTCLASEPGVTPGLCESGSRVRRQAARANEFPQQLKQNKRERRQGVKVCYNMNGNATLPILPVRRPGQRRQPLAPA